MPHSLTIEKKWLMVKWKPQYVYLWVINQEGPKGFQEKQAIINIVCQPWLEYTTDTTHLNMVHKDNNLETAKDLPP